LSNDAFDERGLPGVGLRASRALVSAALGGLLCVGSPACSSNDDAAEQTPALSDAGADRATANAGLDGSQSDSGVGSDSEAADGAAASDANSGTDAAASDATSATDALVASDSAPTSDAPPICDAMPEAGVITSSTVVADMTLEKFTADCDALGGTVEIHPHCGGSNSCKGMSYDTATQTLTEHTCKGLNTCAGYSCIICN
jgi:hypothetical protein